MWKETTMTVWGRNWGILTPLGAIAVTVYPQEGSKSEMKLSALTSAGCKPCESELLCVQAEGKKTRESFCWGFGTSLLFPEDVGLGRHLDSEEWDNSSGNPFQHLITLEQHCFPLCE